MLFRSEYRFKEIDNLWNNPSISIKDKMEEGSKFFNNQRNGVFEMEQNYTLYQNEDVKESILKGKEVISRGDLAWRTYV